MEILIYIVLFGLWFLRNNFKHGFNGGTFLIFIYFIGAVSGFYIMMATNMYDLSRLDFFAILYHCFCLLLFLYPIVYISNKNSFQLPSSLSLRLIYSLIIFFGTIAFVSIVPKLIDVFRIDDGLRRARYLYNQGQLTDDGAVGLIGYLGAFGGALSAFALYFFFFNLVNYANKKKLIIVLLVCSLADPITSLSMVGRGGIVRWALMFLFFYFNFRSQITSSFRKKLMKWGSIFSLPMIVIFLSITISRFSEREYPVYTYILRYLGEPFINFSYIFPDFFSNTTGGKQSFPFLFSNAPNLAGTSLVSTDYSINTFATFVGSFYKDIGFIYTLLLAIIYFLIFFIFYRSARNPNKFFKLFYYIIISQIVINGLFYFQYTGTTKMRTFIAFLILAGILPIVLPKSRKQANYKGNC